jgi:hypothetical protein
MMYDSRMIHTLYTKLLALYPRGFKDQFGESMQQTFNDLCRERQTEGGGGFSFILWTFAETSIGILREHVLLLTKGTTMKNILATTGSVTTKWGGLASFVMAMTFIVAPFIYLVGNLRDALGPLSYDLADFLYGPVWAASLVTVIFTLRERMGEYAPRRMSLALMAALLAAGATVAVACIRSANRHYHLIHPELHLEEASTVLIVWTTLVTGMTSTAWHFLGWVMVLVGSAGWTSRRLPRFLSMLYLAAGALSLFVYLLPNSEANAAALGVVVSIWQGILLWKTEPGGTQAPEINVSQPHQV